MNVQPPKLDRESARRAVDRLFVQFRRERAGKQIARFALEILQRRLKFADRRIARTQDRVERDAGLGFAAAAFDLQPAVGVMRALQRHAPGSQARMGARRPLWTCST